MFSFSLHFVGSPFASEVPSPLAPRNWGQLSAAVAEATTNPVKKHEAINNRGMTRPQKNRRFPENG
jgi:hypothetical protein